MTAYTPEQLGIKPPAGGFQTGGWYQGRQYWGGTLSEPNQIHPSSNQQGAGQQVGAEVRAQSAAAQGVSPQQFDQYLQDQGTAQLRGAGQATAPSSGVSSSSAGFQTAQVPDLIEQYKQLTNTPEIQDNQKKFDDLQSQIDQREAAKNEAIREVTNNPWYSQATRAGKIASINSDADRKINELVKQQQTYVGKLNQAKAEAGQMLGLTVQQYELARAAQPQYSTTQYDDGQNLYLLSYDQQGNITNKALIGPSGSETSGSGATGDASDVHSWANAIQSGFATVSQVPTKMRSSVVAALGQPASGVPTFEEYLQTAQESAQTSFGPQMVEELKQQYNAAYSSSASGYNQVIDFTDLEKKKLEQSNLLDSSRKEQLDYLYGKSTSGRTP